MNTAKTKRTTLGIISVAALLLVGASVLHAHFRPLRGMDCCTPEERAEKIRERISRQLDLNDSQQKQLEGIVGDLMEREHEGGGKVEKSTGLENSTQLVHRRGR